MNIHYSTEMKWRFNELLVENYVATGNIGQAESVDVRELVLNL